MEENKLRELFEQGLQDLDDGSGKLFLYSLLDLDIQYDEDNEKVHISAPITNIMFNQMGIIHGGIITYIADTAMGHLVAAFAENPAVSLELKTQFFRTTNEGSFHAHASFLKKGRNVHFVECDLKDDRDRLLGKVTATFYSVNE